MSEQDLVNAVIDLIRYRGGVATRINAGMRVIDDGGKRRVMRGADAGTSDIIACYKGRYLATECKFGKNKPTTKQLDFLDSVREAGGLALVTWDIDSVIQLLEELA